MRLALHQLFDVSVLFPTAAAARAAWERLFGTTEPSVTVQRPNLSALGTLSEQPMPAEDLDLRRAGPGFDVGQGYVGLKLGLADQFSLRQATTDPIAGRSDLPDPWAPEGRMRVASSWVAGLLSLGGHAVVLHKAAATVKPRDLFLYELGDVRDPAVRPFLAWLDTLVARREVGGVEARTYGMPHAFGAPNFNAATAHGDAFALERVHQAVKYASGLIAAGDAEPFSMQEVSVPLWHQPGRRAPEPAPDAESLRWTVARDPNDLTRLTLSSEQLEQRHPSLLWEQSRAQPEAMPFEPYARALADLLAHRLHAEGLQLVDFPRYEAPGKPPVRVLCFAGGGRALYVTAGLGRVRAQSGTEELATAHAELAISAPDDERYAQPLEGLLLRIGGLALTTPAPGGLKDWDSLAPPQGLRWGSLLVSLEDVPLSPSRPLAVRVLVPLAAEEFPEVRAAPDRAAWYRARVPRMADAIARCQQMLAELTPAR
jgi:hypothetical protein